VAIVVDSGKVMYALPDSFLIHKSEKVTVDDSILVSLKDYQIDYLNGLFTLVKTYLPKTSIIIEYQILPINLQKTYFHRKLIYQTDSIRSLDSIPSIVTTLQKEFIRSNLRKNGSIVRGISLGSNQGLKIESGLRMNISGKITDKVEVIAALTDQTTPIQPEGNTQTLNEIDKVFVQIKSDRFHATMGDYYLSFEGSEFGQYQRKLQGAMGTAEFENYSATIYGAVSKGKYTTNYFLGQEGNQGPYQLKGDRGQIDIIVLAGTEKVWIDGEVMTRGENNDYIIEYSNGQITFTRSRLITSDSRITVDFQYSDLKFQRNLYGAKTQSQLWDEKIKLDFRILRESDNKDNPLEFTLSDENLEQLQKSGDNLDSSYVSGIDSVGPQKGYYIKMDSLGIQFYKYVGKNLGDYNVAFSYVGLGKGDYKSVGFGKYKFVGTGQGSYIPKIFLQPAQSHDLVDFSMHFQPHRNLMFSNEISMSRYDQNLYSNMDDGDNIGYAFSSYFNYHPDKVMLKSHSLGKFSIQSRYRSVNSKFVYIDRTDEIEKNRKWDSAELSTQEEEIFEINTHYQPLKTIQMSGGAGKITKGPLFTSNRWDAKTEITDEKVPALRYQIEKINSDNKASLRRGDWIRQSGSSDYRFKKVRPFFSYLGEVKKDVFQDTTSLGFKYDEWTSGLELLRLKKMSVSGSYIWRDDQLYEQKSFKPQSSAKTQKYQWNYSGSSTFSASAEYIHRDKRYANSDEQNNKKTDLGDLKLNISPLKKALITNWRYQISNTQVAQKERVYVKVTEGEGSYRYNEQTNEYEPYDLGDYELFVRQTDDFLPVVELRASSHIKFTPKKIFNKKSKNQWIKWLSSVSSDTYVRLEEKTQEKDIWSIYRIDLSKFQQPGTTIFGNRSLRQDIFLFQNRRDFSIRLRINTQKQVNYQFFEDGSETHFSEKAIRIIRQFSPLVSIQVDGQTKDKSYLYTHRTDKIIKSNEMNIDFSFRPTQIIELAIKSKFATKKDEAMQPATEADDYSIIPRASYSFRGKGRLNVEIEWTQVKVKPSNRVVPYELVGMNRQGTTWRWNIGLNYNVSKYMRATLSYNGRVEPDRPNTIHIARAEMRAYF